MRMSDDQQLYARSTDNERPNALANNAQHIRTQTSLRLPTPTRYFRLTIKLARQALATSTLDA